MMAFVNSISDYYANYGYSMWNSLQRYFELMAIPFVMWIASLAVYTVSSRRIKRSIDDMIGIFESIVYGFLFICGIKFLIVFFACGIHFVANLLL